jgi:hypothetical protein
MPKWQTLIQHFKDYDLIPRYGFSTIIINTVHDLLIAARHFTVALFLLLGMRTKTK